MVDKVPGPGSSGTKLPDSVKGLDSNAGDSSLGKTSSESVNKVNSTQGIPKLGNHMYSAKDLIKSKLPGGEASQKVNQAAQAVKNITDTVKKVGHAIKGTFAVVKSIGMAAISPIGLVVEASILVIILGVAAGTIIGRNENGDGCGVPGEGSVSFDFGDEDTGGDWTNRANAMGSWLMSQDFSFVKAGKLSKEQVAGIVGNYIHESGVTFARAEMKAGNENRSMDHMSNEQADAWTRGSDPRGLGLAQWTWNQQPGKGDRAGALIRKAIAMGKNWYDPEPQLELMKEELEGSYAGRLNEIGFDDPNKTPEELAVIFFHRYEMTDSSNDALDDRQAKAREFYDKFSPSGSFGNQSSGSCMQQSGGNFDASGVVALAVSIAYTGPDARNQSKVGSDLNGVSKAPQAYKDAKAKAQEVGGPDGMPSLYASCDRFVATVIKLTVDPEIPWGSTTEQQSYLSKSSKWKQYTTKAEAQPGDIWVTKSNGHIILYIGNYEGKDSIAHASYHDRVGAVTSADYLNANLVDANGRAYYGYHFVG